MRSKIILESAILSGIIFRFVKERSPEEYKTRNFLQRVIIGKFWVVDSQEPKNPVKLEKLLELGLNVNLILNTSVSSSMSSMCSNAFELSLVSS